MTRFELAFETTREDWLGCQEEYLRSGPAWQALERKHRRSMVRQAIAAAPVCIIGGALLIGRDGPTRGMYAQGALVGLVFAVLIGFGLPRLNTVDRAKRAHMAAVRYAELSAYTGPTEISINEEGIRVRMPARELVLAWIAAAVSEVEGSVLVTDGGDVRAITPSRAFASAQMRAALLAEAAAWREAGQLSPAERIGRYLAARDLPCPGCGYNLRGVRAERCPECGRGLVLGELVAAKQ